MCVRCLHEANTSLTDLDVAENKIGDQGAAAFADALKATLVLCMR